MRHDAGSGESRGTACRGEEGGHSHPFGDEFGPLAVPAVLRGSFGGGQVRGRYGDQSAKREAVGIRYRVAGTRGGESRGELSRCVGTVAAADPQADSYGGGAEGGDRSR